MKPGVARHSTREASTAITGTPIRAGRLADGRVCHDPSPDRWQVVPLARSIGDHAAAWDELNRRDFDAHPTLNSSYVNALLQHFGDGSEHLCSLDTATGRAAMALLRPSGLGRWSTFLPSAAVRSPVLVRDFAHIRLLLQQLPIEVAALEICCPEPLHTHLNAVPEAVFERLRPSAALRIDLAGTFADYWADRPRDLIERVARSERRVDSDRLQPRHVCTVDPGEMPQAVARCLDLAFAYSTEACEPGSSSDAHRSASLFYVQVMQEKACCGAASVRELWIGDRLAASCLLAVHGSMLVALKLIHDPDFEEIEATNLLLRHIVQESFESRPAPAFEFRDDPTTSLRGWATSAHPVGHWTLYRNSAVNATFMLARIAGSVLLAPVRLNTSPVAALSVDVYRHPNEMAADVQALFDDAERANVEAGLEWYRTLVDSVYPNEAGIRFFVLRKRGQPVAVIPMLFGARGRTRTATALANFYTAHYSPVIKPGLRPEELLPLIAAIRDANGRSATLTFSPMDPRSEAFALLWSTLRLSGLVPFRYFCFGNWYLSRANAGWSDYLASRSSGLRNTIKRVGKKFTADGGELELVLGPERLAEGITAFQEVYAASWKQAEPYPEFVPNLIRACARRGWLRLGIARMNGQPIAAQLWIVAHGRADIYKVAYDERFKPLSPGTVLTAYLMQHVIERDRVMEVDYLIGDDHYKETWMSDRRERWGVIAYNVKTASGLGGCLLELSGRVAKPLTTRIRALLSAWRARSRSEARP